MTAWRPRIGPARASRTTPPSSRTHSYETDDKGVRKPDLATVIPLVDGGTEGFSGHVRTIFPCVSGCFECTLDLFPPQQAVPLCTIAETPRNAAHCILYAHLIEYPKVRAASTAKQPRSHAAEPPSALPHTRARHLASPLCCAALRHMQRRGAPTCLQT